MTYEDVKKQRADKEKRFVLSDVILNFEVKCKNMLIGKRSVCAVETSEN